MNEAIKFVCAFHKHVKLLKNAVVSGHVDDGSVCKWRMTFFCVCLYTHAGTHGYTHISCITGFI